MKFNKLIVFLCLAFSLLSCETKHLSLDRNLAIVPVKAESHSKTRMISSVTRTSKNYDIGSNIALLPNDKIWATGGWNSRQNVFYSSSNRGKDWEIIELPVESLSVSANITFSDSENGWAVGWLRMVKTHNGGSSWEKMEVPKESKITDLQSVRFFDSQIGYIGGTTGYMNKENYEPVQGLEILCTEDGGKNWRVCYKNNKHNSIYDIVTLSESSAIGLTGGGSLFLITEDQGRKWKEINLPTPVTSIAVNNDGTIWLVGESGFQFSKDKGQTWNPVLSVVQNGEKQSWNSLDFNADGIGVAVGENGRIAITKNNGKTWEIKTDLTSENLLKVKIQNSFVVILGEKNLYTLNVN